MIYIYLIQRMNQEALIHSPYIIYNGQPVYLIDDRYFMLIFTNQFISINPNHQIITILLGIIQKIQVSHMKHIIDTLRIAYLVMWLCHCSPSIISLHESKNHVRYPFSSMPIFNQRYFMEKIFQTIAVSIIIKTINIILQLHISLSN